MVEMNQVEEKMPLSFVPPTSAISCQAPQGAAPEKEMMTSGGGRRRRRRRRAREEGEEGKKRRLSEEQVKFLEKSFRKERKLEVGRKVHLAMEAGLEPKQVAVWFQNRRARWKSKQLEEEYVKLKSVHDSELLEKHRLQAEVLRLEKQLLEAEKEIRSLSSRLSGGTACGGELSSSPTISTSHSIETNAFFPGHELEPRGEDDLGFILDEHYAYVNTFNWLNFYGMC